MGWDDVRQNIAFGLGWLKARENSIQAQGTTLEQSILEEVVALDSSQVDAVETLGEGNLIDYSDDGSVRPGELQRLEQLRNYFFGDSESGQQGLFDAMREMDDPNFLEDPDL